MSKPEMIAKAKHDVYVAVLTLDDAELWAAVEEALGRLRDAPDKGHAEHQADAHDVRVLVLACGLRDTARNIVAEREGTRALRTWMADLLGEIERQDAAPADRRRPWWAWWRR